MGEVITLVREAANQETVNALRAMLREAEAGTICGVAAIVTYRGGEYAGFLTGSTRAHPTLTRGMLDELKDEL